MITNDIAHSRSSPEYSGNGNDCSNTAGPNLLAYAAVGKTWCLVVSAIVKKLLQAYCTVAVFVEKSGSGEVVPYILTTSPRSNKLSPTYFIKVPLPKISDISAVFLFMTDISPVLTGPWTRGVSVVWADLEGNTNKHIYAYCVGCLPEQKEY